MEFINKDEVKMDKDFEQKVKKKKLRTIAVAVVVIVIGVFLFFDTQVEKADYSKDLSKEIKSAQELLRESRQDKSGNEEGQYSEYTLIAFDNQIKEAQAIATSEASEYNDKKHAYEKLKELSKTFKKDTNKDVISKDKVKKLMDNKETKEFTTEIKKDTEITYSIDGSKLKKATTINLMAREAGPYEKEVNRFFGQIGLRGVSVSFYQEGNFGGKIKVKTPIYTEGNESKGFVYKYDVPTGIISFVGEAEINNENQVTTFEVEEGGVYFVTPKDLHSELGQNDVLIEDVEKKYAVAVDEELGDETVDVSIEIRCDVLSEDLSKLKKSELREYVPKDGAVLKETTVTMNKGASVFDVLNKVCRNKNIQLETSYTPAYGAYYVEGINYLYEFDAGNLSGWTYQVNGKTPSYGCSSYIVKSGDKITWQYTCDLGKDVGSYVEEK